MAREGKNEGARILHCHCSYPFQDKRYGRGRRVHNGCAKGWRCTVCKDEKIT